MPERPPLQASLVLLGRLAPRGVSRQWPIQTVFPGVLVQPGTAPHRAFSMRPSLFPSDKDLPTWLHTVLLFSIAAPFALPLLWTGVQAIATRHLVPLGGPDFQQFFFAGSSLSGAAAITAGISLIFLGSAFVALAGSFSRPARGRPVLHLLPWVLLAIHVALSVWIKPIA